MTEQSEGLGAASAVEAAMDAVVIANLADHLEDGAGKPATGAPLPLNCLNCGALVRGRYCIDCGQVTDTHVPTLAEVIGDALTSLFNLDSRLWRTLGTLFLAPGLLTQDFLAGKRARYVPPLRLYLVMSVLLFLVASLDRNEADAPPEQSAEAAAILAEVAAELEAEGTVDADEAERIRNGDGNAVGLDSNLDCDEMELPFTPGGAIHSAIMQSCLEGVEDDFRSLKDAFSDNIPLLAFLVIPVMAAVFKFFYAFSGRAYIGHLVLLCHTHAFTFMLVIGIMLAQLINDAVGRPLGGFLGVLAFSGLLLYMPVYYYKSLRRVYAQHWALTFVKLIALMMIYAIVVTAVFSLGFLTIAVMN